MNFPSELTHEFLARGVCVRADGQVLLCRQKNGKRSFLPGGHVDPNEGARYALARECEEELGLHATVGGILGFAEHKFPDAKDRKDPPDGWTYEFNVVFALTLDNLPADGTAPQSREPWQEFFWWPLNDLAGAGFEPACMRDALPAWVAHGPTNTPLASVY